MKKTYIAPEFTQYVADTQNIIAVSLKPGLADDSVVLVKENNDWNIWGDDEVEE